MRSPRLPVALLAVLLLAVGACDRTASAPTQPRAPSFSTAGDPALATAVHARIDALFLDESHRQQAHNYFANAESYWAAGRVGDAREKVQVTVRFTVDLLPGGNLIADCDGDGPETAVSCSVALFNDMFAYVGLPTAKLGSNATVTLVVPRDTTQTIDSRLDLYAVIPGGSLGQVALLYVERDTTGAEIDDGLRTASDLYDVRFIPEATEFDSLTVAVCAAPPPPSSARLAHGLGSGEIEVLDPVEVNIHCDDVEQVGSLGDALREGGVTRMLATLVDRAAGLLAPRPLFAGHAATAGTVIELSPFQIVVTGTAIDASASSVTYGQSVDVSGLLRYEGGTTPVPGKSLSLAVDGTAVGSQTTDASGTASWSVGGLGAGSHGYAIAFAGELTTTGDTLLRPSSATGTFSVGQAPLTLTASSATVIFGDPIPACSVAYSGLVAGDTPSSIGTVSTCAYPTALGTHTVWPSVISPANYAVTRVSGTFVHRYASSAGVFISPLPMREIKRGSKIPVKFELEAANGTPIANRTIHLRVIQLNSANVVIFDKALGNLVYNASKGTYDLSVDTNDWPFGVVRLVAELDDGTQRTVDEIIK